MKRRERMLAFAGIVLLAAAAVFQLAARMAEGFATVYAHSVYGVIVGVVGRFFGIFPFSVVEILLYFLIFACILYLFFNWKHPLGVLCFFVFLAGVLAFLYTCNCGINYYAAPFSGYAGLKVRSYSKEELEGLCEFLVEQVNQTAAPETYRGTVNIVGEANVTEDIGNSGVDEAGKESWRREAVRAMQQLGREFPSLGGFYPLPKEVMVSWILSVQQLCGVYSPFTVEANFNGDMPDYNIPHTMCHELSHLKGFMREDEANFIGYLACIGSDCQAFRYSGYLMGWIYAGNALAGVDRDSYMELHEKLCSQAKADLQENNAFWNQYEGKVAEVSNQVNDAYLKANGREDGVRSYGRAVDLMLAYYYNESPRIKPVRAQMIGRFHACGGA